MERRYRDIAIRLHLSVQRTVKAMKGHASSSEDEEPCDSSVADGVFRSYRRSGGDNLMLNRTKNMVEESLSGRCIACLICIASIKRNQAIWTCDHCHSYFHLPCIQQWANDSVNQRTEENQGTVTVHKPAKVEWCCPKCRQAYPKEQIPRKYICFCGKTDSPPLHPWRMPHTCGTLCGKRLSTGDNCRHKCLLLCHPGPCPPCPQTVDGICYCEKEHKKVRCSAAKWSCGQECQKALLCQTHKCKNVCHDGECPPCSYTSKQMCQCGSEKSKRPCSDPFWQCTKVCNKPFSCGHHKCDQVCHSGSCGSCPNSGMQSCPCGAVQRSVQCPDVMETCLGTCNKKRDNCEHSCSEKCHKGPCPPCLVLIEKKCNCASHTRSLPCNKEFKCETKCRGTRPCGKHSCTRKCCNGNCLPCDKTCDKPLQCGRHKCANICHQGPCYPCPLESKVPCRCKETYASVQCGREKNARPPRCPLPCKIKYKCSHYIENNHRCHFGNCPPCRAICNKKYPTCEHACVSACHMFVSVVFKQLERPATPSEVQAPQTRIVALDCPPCRVPLPVVCFGGHEMDEQPCHSAARKACGRKCGKPLACGNHKCTLDCHLLIYDSQYPHVPYECKPCNQDCEMPRPPNCTHKCAIGACHAGKCPPCDVYERLPCNCGTTALYFRCRELSTATEELLSCKQQCPKNLECGHRCRNTCHSGACGKDQTCTKKTKIYCQCGNLKKEAPCNAVRNGKANVTCNESCEAKKLAADLENEKEQQRLKQLEEERNKKELAEYEWKLSGKKKKYKEKKAVIYKDDRNWVQKYWMYILPIFVVILAEFYYIFFFGPVSAI